MSIHVCKQCGSRFEYCRMCVFRPIRYKDAGFCSKECYEASKNVVAPTVKIEPIVEEISIVEPIVEDEVESSIEDIQPIEDVEVEVEAVVSAETPIETTTAVESEIKNETSNTYKNKKNKYETVHE